MGRVLGVLLMFLAAISLLPRFGNTSVGAAAPLPAPRGAPGQSLAIVVNQLNPVNDISMAELQKVFLGVRSHWPHGRRIAVVMMESGTPERITALREIYHMSEDAYRDHFLRGLFTGDVFVSPKTLASPSVVRKFVFNAPGAIGYLRDTDVDTSVKVLRIDGHLPSDRDYRLQMDTAPAN